MQIEQITINGVSFNRTDSEKCWRLIHDGNLVISLEEGVGVLSTQLNIFLAKSKEACLAEIYKLNLEYYPSEEE
jgi:hypothetical protein